MATVFGTRDYLRLSDGDDAEVRPADAHRLWVTERVSHLAAVPLIP